MHAPQLLAFAVIALTCFSGVPAEAREVEDPIAAVLRSRLEDPGDPPRVRMAERTRRVPRELPDFYERRAYKPAWSSDARLSASVAQLLEALDASGEDGLRPSDYGAAQLRVAANRPGPNSLESLADLDLALSSACLELASHLVNGRLDPLRVGNQWAIEQPEIDLVSWLEDAVAQGVTSALQALRPDRAGYGRLRVALGAYTKLRDAGGWPSLPPGDTLELGSTGKRVATLKRRLAITGDLVRGDASEAFDATLDDAVRSAQRRHGLEPDGRVGPRTREALNTTAAQRVRQIVWNLERWRWLPRALGRRHVRVNIAGFEVEAVDDGVSVLRMDAVVGRPYRRTPVFADSITHVVFSPYWHVPTGIARRDIIPRVRRSRGYLEGQGMRVLDRDAGGVVDPSTIDWSSAAALRYRFRQDPGPNNALGLVKFLFPNRWSVYLHDTPAKQLFSETVRTFSSGCIRVSKPLELAEFLLRDDSSWNRERIKEAMRGGTETAAFLREVVPIYILYSTAWVDEAGLVQFRDDVYGRDERLARAWRAAAP